MHFQSVDSGVLTSDPLLGDEKHMDLGDSFPRGPRPCLHHTLPRVPAPVHLTLASGHPDSLSAWRAGWRGSPRDRRDPGGHVKERESGMWLQGSQACVEKRTPGQSLRGF